MEPRKTIHYEIQFEKSDGEWAELLQERPKTEEEISESRDRARAASPGQKIRAVKVTTTVTIEDVSEEPRSAILAPEFDVLEPHHKVPVNELLQDCD